MLTRKPSVRKAKSAAAGFAKRVLSGHMWKDEETTVTVKDKKAGSPALSASARGSPVRGLSPARSHRSRSSSPRVEDARAKTKVNAKKTVCASSIVTNEETRDEKGTDEPLTEKAKGKSRRKTGRRELRVKLSHGKGRPSAEGSEEQKAVDKVCRVSLTRDLCRAGGSGSKKGRFEVRSEVKVKDEPKEACEEAGCPDHGRNREGSTRGAVGGAAVGAGVGRAGSVGQDVQNQDGEDMPELSQAIADQSPRMPHDDVSGEMPNISPAFIKQEPDDAESGPASVAEPPGPAGSRGGWREDKEVAAISGQNVQTATANTEWNWNPTSKITVDGIDFFDMGEAAVSLAGSPSAGANTRPTAGPPTPILETLTEDIKSEIQEDHSKSRSKVTTDLLRSYSEVDKGTLDVPYPCDSVQQNQYFSIFGLVKKSDIKAQCTRNKLHREAGGKLRRVVKPRMDPAMVYKKLTLAKGCVIQGDNLTQVRYEDNDYRQCKAADSPTLAQQRRNRSPRPHDAAMDAIVKLSQHEAAASGGPCPLVKTGSFKDNDLPSNIQRKLNFVSSDPLPGNAAKKQWLKPPPTEAKKQWLKPPSKKAKSSSSHALATPRSVSPYLPHGVVVKEEILEPKEKKAVQVRDHKGKKQGTASSSRYRLLPLPTARRLPPPPERRAAAMEDENTRKSARNRSGPRKEWWHLLRAAPDEYQRDEKWEQEQEDKEKKLMAKAKIAEARKVPGEDEEGEDDGDDEEEEEEEEEEEDNIGSSQECIPSKASVKPRRRRSNTDEGGERKRKKLKAPNSAVMAVLAKSSDARVYADLYEEMSVVKASEKRVDWDLAKNMLEEAQARKKAADQSSAQPREKDASTSPSIFPAKLRNKKRKNKKTYPKLEPEGDADGKEWCGNPGLPYRDAAPVAGDAEDTEAGRAAAIAAMEEQTWVRAPAEVHREIECHIPHMCIVCWINDHMYCKNMKRIARKMPALGGCLHFRVCDHYLKSRQRKSHRGYLSTVGMQGQDDSAADPADIAPRATKPARIAPLNGDDLLCEEQMIESDPESPPTPEGTEALKIQLRVRAAQIAQSLGVDRLPSTPPTRGALSGLVKAASRADAARREGTDTAPPPQEVLVTQHGAEVVIRQGDPCNYLPNKEFTDDTAALLGCPVRSILQLPPVTAPGTVDITLDKLHIRLMPSGGAADGSGVMDVSEEDGGDQDKHQLMKVHVQRLNADTLVLKRVAAGCRSGDEGEILKEIKLPLSVRTASERDLNNWLNTVLAKEALRLVNKGDPQVLSPGVRFRKKCLMSKERFREMPFCKPTGVRNTLLTEGYGSQPQTQRRREGVEEGGEEESDEKMEENDVDTVPQSGDADKDGVPVEWTVETISDEEDEEEDGENKEEGDESAVRQAGGTPGGGKADGPLVVPSQTSVVPAPRPRRRTVSLSSEAAQRVVLVTVGYIHESDLAIFVLRDKEGFPTAMCRYVDHQWKRLTCSTWLIRHRDPLVMQYLRENGLVSVLRLKLDTEVKAMKAALKNKDASLSQSQSELEQKRCLYAAVASERLTLLEDVRKGRAGAVGEAVPRASKMNKQRDTLLKLREQVLKKLSLCQKVRDVMLTAGALQESMPDVAEKFRLWDVKEALTCPELEEDCPKTAPSRLVSKEGIPFLPSKLLVRPTSESRASTQPVSGDNKSRPAMVTVTMAFPVAPSLGTPLGQVSVPVMAAAPMVTSAVTAAATRQPGGGQFILLQPIGKGSAQQMVAAGTPQQLVAVRGPQKLVAVRGPQQLVAVRGPQQLVAASAPQQLVAVRGPQELVATCTPQQLVAVRGPQQLVATSTPQQLVATGSPQQLVATSTPQEPVATSTHQQLVATGTPQQLVATSTPQQPVATSTPQELVATSTHQQPVATSTPQIPVATSTHQQLVATGTPQQPVATGTPQQHLATSTPQQLVATGTPQQLVVTSTPQQLMVTSTPQQLVATGTPQQLVVTSTPQQLMVTSTPQQLVATGTPQQLVVTSTPQQLMATGTPQQLMVTSTPQQLVATSTPEQLMVNPRLPATGPGPLLPRLQLPHQQLTSVLLTQEQMRQLKLPFQSLKPVSLAASGPLQMSLEALPSTTLTPTLTSSLAPILAPLLLATSSGPPSYVAPPAGRPKAATPSPPILLVNAEGKGGASAEPVATVTPAATAQAASKGKSTDSPMCTLSKVGAAAGGISVAQTTLAPCALLQKVGAVLTKDGVIMRRTAAELVQAEAVPPPPPSPPQTAAATALASAQAGAKYRPSMVRKGFTMNSLAGAMRPVLLLTRDGGKVMAPPTLASVLNPPGGGGGLPPLVTESNKVRKINPGDGAGSAVAQKKVVVRKVQGGSSSSSSQPQKAAKQQRTVGGAIKAVAGARRASGERPPGIAPGNQVLHAKIPTSRGALLQGSQQQLGVRIKRPGAQDNIIFLSTQQIQQLQKRPGQAIQIRIPMGHQIRVAGDGAVAGGAVQGQSVVTRAAAEAPSPRVLPGGPAVAPSGHPVAKDARQVEIGATGVRAPGVLIQDAPATTRSSPDGTARPGTHTPTTLAHASAVTVTTSVSMASALTATPTVTMATSSVAMTAGVTMAKRPLAASVLRQMAAPVANSAASDVTLPLGPRKQKRVGQAVSVLSADVAVKMPRFAPQEVDLPLSPHTLPQTIVTAAACHQHSAPLSGGGPAIDGTAMTESPSPAALTAISTCGGVVMDSADTLSFESLFQSEEANAQALMTCHPHEDVTSAMIQQMVLFEDEQISLTQTSTTGVLESLHVGIPSLDNTAPEANQFSDLASLASVAPGHVTGADDPMSDQDLLQAALAQCDIQSPSSLPAELLAATAPGDSGAAGYSCSMETPSTPPSVVPSPTPSPSASPVPCAVQTEAIQQCVVPHTFSAIVEEDGRCVLDPFLADPGEILPSSLDSQGCSQESRESEQSLDLELL